MILTAAMFGGKHIIGLLAIIALYVFIYIFVNKKKVPKEKVLLILTITLLALEATKLLYMIIRDGTFPMHHLPFHLCSLPLYVYTILAFCKNDKIKEMVKPAAFAGVLFGGIVAVLYPVNIIGNLETWQVDGDNFLPFISFIFHGAMVFLSIYIIKSGIYTYKFNRIKDAYIVILAFMVLAMIVNAITGRDFMLLNTGNGSPLEFLLESGQLIYTGAMIVLGLIGVLIFHSIGLLIKKK